MNCSPIKKFKVVGWYKPFEHDAWGHKTGNDVRRTLGEPKTILAPDGLTAAFMYAHACQIHHTEWYEVGPTPPVVIRVEEVL